jgi:hypothetical protein
MALVLWFYSDIPLQGPFQNGLNTCFTVAEFLDQCGRKILGGDVSL